MRVTEANAVSILKRGGAVLASEWTTGRGRHVSKRPIPIGCAEVSRRSIEKLPGETKRAARRILKEHPRAQKLIVVVDRRTVGKLAKAVEAEERALAEEIKLAEETLSEKSSAAFVAMMADTGTTNALAAWLALPEEQRHPAPPEVLSAKLASGLAWCKFEKELVKKQGEKDAQAFGTLP